MHKTLNPFVIHCVTTVHKFFMYSSNTIPTFVVVKYLLNLSHKFYVSGFYNIYVVYLEIISGFCHSYCS